MTTQLEQFLYIPVDDVHIEGMLELPHGAQAIVLFAHGSGSTRHSPQDNFVARALREKEIGTLSLDLLTLSEDLDYLTRFDIALLTHRLLVATRWVKMHYTTRHLVIGYYGAGSEAAATLQAAAALGEEVGAVVSRGGRPDLAGSHDLAKVRSPTLLLVGSLDEEVLELNREAHAGLHCTKELTIVAGASHGFGEAGALEEVARHAGGWFHRYLTI